MSATRKSSGKKKTSRKSSNKRKTNRRRKPKVTLNTKGVLTLTLVIVLVCVAFLAVSIYMGRIPLENSPSNVDSVGNGTTAELQSGNSAAKTQEAEKKQSAASVKSGENGSSVSLSQSASEKDKSASKSNQNKSTQNTASESKSTEASSSAGKASSENGSLISSGEEIAKVTSSDKKAPSVKPAQEDVKKCPFDIPEAKNGAVLVIVIDDAGQNINNLKKYTNLPFPITIALLPKLENSKACSWVVRSSGKELILHQPMQSLNLNLYPGPGYIDPDMSTVEIAALVKENLDEVGPVKGMNNHEGSLITENVIKIGAVLEVCEERGIYFLDSRTTAQTQAPQAALERDMEILERDVFLDDVVTREAELEQFYRALSIANKKGKVIMIGHVDKSVNILPALLEELYPYLLEKGYTFATPSALLTD